MLSKILDDPLIQNREPSKLKIVVDFRYQTSLGGGGEGGGLIQNCLVTSNLSSSRIHPSPSKLELLTGNLETSLWVGTEGVI